MSDDPRRGFGFASGSGGGGGGGAPGGGGGAPSQNRISSQTNANTQVQNNHNQSASQPNALQGNTVFVSRTQNGNPLLRHIRNVRWVFADVVPDFVLNENACVVFISLRYHLLHPTYLPTKIAALQKAFRLRVVLCQVDTEDVIKPLGEVNKIAAMGGCSLLCAWSPEEAGRYVETLKAFEKKAPDIIKERVETDYLGRLQAALTSVRGVNKTDATSLGANFGSFAGVLRASEAQLAATPGLGPTKVKRLREAANAPFRRRGGGTSGTTNGTTNGTQPATEVLPPPE